MSFPVNSGLPITGSLQLTDIDTFQTGPVCKLAALRTCMKLLHPDDCYPLFKNKMPDTPLSVRSIAKKLGSSQGEVTSPCRLVKIAQQLGLEAEPKRFDNQAQMESYIHRAIDEGKPVIVFVPIDPEDTYPSSNDKFSAQCYEHASVVLAYNKTLRSFNVHDGCKLQIWGASDLYKSSCCVLKERAQETFIKLLKLRPQETSQHSEGHSERCSDEGQNVVKTDDLDTENHQNAPEPMNGIQVTHAKN